MKSINLLTLYYSNFLLIFFFIYKKTYSSLATKSSPFVS